MWLLGCACVLRKGHDFPHQKLNAGISSLCWGLLCRSPDPVVPGCTLVLLMHIMGTLLWLEILTCMRHSDHSVVCSDSFSPQLQECSSRSLRLGKETWSPLRVKPSDTYCIAWASHSMLSCLIENLAGARGLPTDGPLGS